MNIRKQIIATTDTSSWAYKGVLTGKINKVSSDPKDVIPGSSVIVICTPAHVKLEILQNIKNYLDKDCFVGIFYTIVIKIGSIFG